MQMARSTARSTAQESDSVEFLGLWGRGPGSMEGEEVRKVLRSPGRKQGGLRGRAKGRNP